MSKGLRLAIAGAGATGRAHAAAAAGFKITLAADPIPDRLKALCDGFKIEKSVDRAEKFFSDASLSDTFDAICICLPTQLHASIAQAALKAGKHVLVEMPPAPTSKDARAIEKAAEKFGKTVLYSAVRRYGAAEQSARQAIEKGHVGKIYHARASILRTRGVPRGTGWYQDPAKTGGGAIIDLALPMIDLIEYLSGAKIKSVSAVASNSLMKMPVEEAGSMLIRFDNGMSADIACAWAINQPPNQAGTVCRLSGESGAVDLYTPQGPTVYRNFDDKGQSKSTPLKLPKVAGHAALMRHFRNCISGEEKPTPNAADGVRLMQIAEAIYKSVASGKVVEL